jgi:hypothetical protein
MRILLALIFVFCVGCSDNDEWTDQEASVEAAPSVEMVSEASVDAGSAEAVAIEASAVEAQVSE